ncbi:MAG: type II toxin-antitoxin system HicA family toxin [Odoribacteraceae bacterium]|jgi:predicted RNA binding protein YcfA (HicA-like mRNA interferase family)|nr:type II toxin-antitoxin system HicA family toxin [Odoribacteraceae bacterium]
MKPIKVSEIVRILHEDGWYLVKMKGSHRHFKHPAKPGKVTVNGSPSTEIYGSLLKSIEKQSGLVF